MITLHGEEVKVGDRVWSMCRGWGEVKKVANERLSILLMSALAIVVKSSQKMGNSMRLMKSPLYSGNQSSLKSQRSLSKERRLGNGFAEIMPAVTGLPTSTL